MAEPFGVQVKLEPKINASDLASAVKKAAATKTASGAFTIPSVTIKKIDAKDAIRGLKSEIEGQLKQLKIGDISFSSGKGKSSTANKTSSGLLNQSMSSELKAAQKINDRIARDALKIQTDNGVFKTDNLIAYEEKLKEVRAAFNALVEAQKHGGDSGALASSFSTAVKEADALKVKIQEEAREISNVQVLIDSLSKKSTDLRSAGRIGDADALDGYVNNLKTAQQAIIENKSYTQEQYQALIQAAEAARKYSESLGSSAVSVKTVNDKILEMQRYMQQNTNLSDKTRQEIESIIAALQEMSRSGKIDPGQFKLLTQHFSQLKVAAYEAGETGSSAMQRIGQVIKRFATNKLSTQMFTYIRQLCREMANAVKDVDSAMTQLSIVTGASGSQMVKFFDEASVAAKNLGASVSDVLDSIQVFSRLGYNLNDSLELSSAATVLSNVAATSVDEATTGLTSIIKGFGIEASDAMSVADILTEVGQKYAVSAEELMEALERGGSSLQAANNSLEEAVALVAAGNASVQDASSVGTSLKTMAARIDILVLDKPA